MVIEFDAAKDATNQRKHGLSLEVVAEFTAAALVVPTYPGSDVVRFKLIQPTAHGLLVAIVTPRATAVRVISVRHASRKEARFYAEAIR